MPSGDQAGSSFRPGARVSWVGFDSPMAMTGVVIVGVLCALAFHDVFAAGASYYGIGDLEALRRETHKFESHYDQSLIGPYPDRRDLYVARSPLHAVDRIRHPVIFFQGLDDRVVPAGQAKAMAAALQARGIRVELVTFAGEGHGFRRAETIARALEEELAFYRAVLRLPAEIP